MLTANDKNGIKVNAYCAPKGGAYTCPYCGAEVVLKYGFVKMAHFAHKSLSDCEGSGESSDHMNGKQLIYDLLVAQGITAIMEDTEYRDMRPDVTAYIGGRKVAFEIQKSYLSQDDINRRNRNYKKHNIPVCWILDEKRTGEIFESMLFNSKVQERYFKALNNGILIGIYKDEIFAFTLSDVHTPVKISKKSGEYYDPKKMEKSLGKKVSINLAKDLYPATLERSRKDGFYLPERLYLCLCKEKAQEIANPPKKKKVYVKR